MRGIFQGHLVGNAVRPIEIRSFGDGRKVGSTSVAINDGKKENSSVMFAKITFWDKNAELASQFVKKGTPLFCEGSVSLETYRDSSGQERSSINLNVSKFLLLGGYSYSNNNNASAAASVQPQYTPQQVVAVNQFGSAPQDSQKDDIPF